MNATTLQEQARALGDPTRHAISRRIAGGGRPVGTLAGEDDDTDGTLSLRGKTASPR